MENRFRGWRRYASVQPPVMVLLFAQSLSGTILTDLIVYRTCIVTMGINETECSLLHTNSSDPEALKIDAQVQPQASLIIMSKSFVETIFPAILSLFLGPWSDKYGRRPLILSGYIGISLTYVILSVISNWNVSPWLLLLAYIPSAISGGFCILILACICYIADITDTNNRTKQLVWLDALIYLGVLLGIYVGPLLFNAFGYAVVFIISTISCILALVYVYYCVPETIDNMNIRTLGSLFDISLVKDMLSTCTRKRNGYDRCIVWCCMSSLTILVINMQGEYTIGYLFASARLGWDVSAYSIYMATSLILSITATTLVVTIFKKNSGLSDGMIALLSVFSSLSSAVTKAFAWQAWHMYFAVALGMFGGVASPTIRAILSKAVPSEDAGKVFSLATSIETLTPFGAASLFAMVYSSSMPPVYPSPVWLVCSALFVAVILLLIIIQVLSRTSDSLDSRPLIRDSI